MKTHSRQRLWSITLGVLLVSTVVSSAPVFGQTRYNARGITITISGTSTLHDWKETSTAGTSEAVFTLTNDKITSLNSLSFTMPANSLKSEHSLMNSNTYKALKADKNPNITFVGTSASIVPATGNTYTIKTRGKLTIAGTTRETELVATATVNADRSITVNGSRRIKMTEYNVTPPKVMMIKTGDDLTISFSLKYNK
jgi:DNA polymerase III sliding clamp (beta) subunit (PCNA family)